MRKQCLILMLVAAFVAVCSGCTTRSKIARIGPDRLIADTEIMFQAFRKTGEEYGAIPPRLWPDSISKLSPKGVRTFERGVLLLMRSSARRETGVYIVTENPQIPVTSGSGDGFTKIADRIYLAEIKIRQRSIADTEPSVGSDVKPAPQP